ncbi:MAG: GntR family transcriptional regulator [Sphaerochaetaceae bacterium]|nr:GntR family transcriptional regulator [Sphaerochaetaceae bacterium]
MKISRKTLSDEVYKRILELVKTHELVPGTRIDFKELEERFGVSQVPLREAVQRLMANGLVTSTPRGGYFIVKLAPEDIHALFQVRITIERSALVTSIGKIPKEELLSVRQEFKEELDNFSKLGEMVPSERYKKADWKLHFNLIVGYSESQVLKNMLANIFDLLETTRNFIGTLSSQSLIHIDIIDAILNKDLDKALSLLQIHLENSERRILVSMQQNSDK